jgi:hypothetical protein
MDTGNISALGYSGRVGSHGTFSVPWAFRARENGDGLNALFARKRCAVRARYFQPLKLDPLGGDLCEVIVRLLSDPAFGAAAKDLRQSEVHLGRNAALFVKRADYFPLRLPVRLVTRSRRARSESCSWRKSTGFQRQSKAPWSIA